MRYRLNSKGMTLIELMIVVTLISIAAALTIPRFGNTIHRLKVKTAARDIVSKLRLARSYAITNKVPYGINIDNAGSVITTFIDTENPGSYTFTANDSIINVDSLPEEFQYVYSYYGNPTVIYEPNGSSATSNRLYFVSYNGESVCWGEVSILAATGRTKLEYVSYY